MLATRTPHRQDDAPLGSPEMEPRNRTGLRRNAPRHEVLVVDDDPSFAEVVAEGLQDEDIVPIVVSDPREALRLAGERPFAVAVLDLVMPGIDGLELSRQLRKKSPELEVVLLTGHVSIHSAIEGIRNEVFDYFQKTTLNPIRLRRAVRAAIARREMRQAESRNLAVGRLDSERKLKALCEVSGRLAGARGADDVLAELVRTARALSEAESARALIMERAESGDLTLLAAAGDGAATVEDRLDPREGLATLVANTGAPLRLEAPRAHPRYSPRCDQMPAEGPGLLGVPLSRPGFLGVLTVAGRARPFAEEDATLLQLLAHQGAAALEAVRARAR